MSQPTIPISRLSKTLLALAMVLGAAASAFAAGSETVLYNFSGSSTNPSAGLVADANGNLYGVTGLEQPNCTQHCGSVFELSPSATGWSFNLLYEFKGGGDGVDPQGPLAFDIAGNLYGTTTYGGGSCPFQKQGCGTVFELSPNSNGSWSESVLHRFKQTSDGAAPVTGVILDASGNVYGTTEFAGLVNTISPNGCGTVYELTPTDASWTFTVLHTLVAATGCSGGMLAFDTTGNLYVAAGTGGTANNHCGNGCGLIFKLTPGTTNWTESVLYKFTGGSDGDTPFPLIFGSDGNLYGAALFGGSGACAIGDGGCGTIFWLTPSGSSWSFSLLQSFNGNDGELPIGITLAANGNLYGATEDGGTASTKCSDGCGTVFELTPTAIGEWTETVLHAFTGGNDGSQPSSGVILDASGNLYGVASEGGTNSGGVAFEITP
jgi:uncharacterized repeat protein (TIGR03803 family)